MKTAGRIWTLLFAVGLAGLMLVAPTGRADAEIPESDETLEREWRGPARARERDRSPGYRGPGVEARGGPAVEQWLQRLREEDPGEYERLEALRETDPEAFREELRGRLRERQMLQELRRRHPHLHEFVRGQPRHERERMMRTMLEMRDWPPERAPHRHPRLPPGPETQERQSRMRQLVREYRAETDPGKQEEIREQIRIVAAELYDLREAHQLERIRQMEERLNRLKENLEQHREQRDDHIERYIEELLK